MIQRGVIKDAHSNGNSNVSSGRYELPCMVPVTHRLDRWMSLTVDGIPFIDILMIITPTIPIMFVSTFNDLAIDDRWPTGGPVRG